MDNIIDLHVGEVIDLEDYRRDRYIVALESPHGLCKGCEFASAPRWCKAFVCDKFQRKDHKESIFKAISSLQWLMAKASHPERCRQLTDEERKRLEDIDRLLRKNRAYPTRAEGYSHSGNWKKVEVGGDED